MCKSVFEEMQSKVESSNESADIKIAAIKIIELIEVFKKNTPTATIGDIMQEVARLLKLPYSG